MIGLGPVELGIVGVVAILMFGRGLPKFGRIHPFRRRDN